MMDPAADDSYDSPPPAREGRQLARLSVLLWLAGMPGVLAIAWQVGGRLGVGSLPFWAMPSMVGLQGALLLAACVFFGGWVAPRVGLGAPVLKALVGREPLRPALQQMWLPGIGGGVLGAAWMVTLSQLTVDGLMPGDPLQNLPLWAKLLYGGVTAELLVHCGGMTLLLFALWRLVQPQGGAPRRWLAWLTIVLAAAVFALGHLPTALTLIDTLTPHMLTYVLVGNGVWALFTGYIYWRYGLEAAIVAHVLALGLSHGLT